MQDIPKLKVIIIKIIASFSSIFMSMQPFITLTYVITISKLYFRINHANPQL